jgi:hypothetical protein
MHRHRCRLLFPLRHGSESPHRTVAGCSSSPENPGVPLRGSPYYIIVVRQLIGRIKGEVPIQIHPGHIENAVWNILALGREPSTAMRRLATIHVAGYSQPTGLRKPVYGQGMTA